MKEIPRPAFADDDGRPDPALAEALQRFAADATPGPVLAALAETRVLVPVVAELGESEVSPEGLLRDKTADVSAVLLTGADGRRALLAFTGVESLSAWDAHARPVPMGVAEAARTAAHIGASALVIDLAGPQAFVIETRELHELASGSRVIATPEGFAWTQPITAPDRDSPPGVPGC